MGCKTKSTGPGPNGIVRRNRQSGDIMKVGSLLGKIRPRSAFGNLAVGGSVASGGRSACNLTPLAVAGLLEEWPVTREVASG